jgi:hypothetical protein
MRTSPSTQALPLNMPTTSSPVSAVTQPSIGSEQVVNHREKEESLAASVQVHGSTKLVLTTQAVRIELQLSYFG